MTTTIRTSPVRCVVGAALTAILIWGCGGSAPSPIEDYENLSGRAVRLAREIPIVDTHIDVPYRLESGFEDLSQHTAGGDFDYERARIGGLDVAFMSIYVPADLEGAWAARAKADELIDRVESWAEQWPQQFVLASSVSEVERQLGSGRVVLSMGMENGAPIGDDLGNLEHFFERGIRYITLTHSRDNQISDSSFDEARTWGGLSPFGREVVTEMNRLGIMIDISHVSDAAFFEVLEVTNAPVIASHSSCRRFTPGWERNMSDEQILALAENGGVIQINFGSAFLTAEANADSTALWDELETFMEGNGYGMLDEETTAYLEQLYLEHPPVLADVADVADHIDHVVGLVGVEHVGLGSDFDGVGPTTPTGLRDVSAYPNLIRVLLERGYSDDEIEKICGGNLLRVWAEIEARSQGVGDETATES